jgi:hypothetical protein
MVENAVGNPMVIVNRAAALRGVIIGMSVVVPR